MLYGLHELNYLKASFGLIILTSDILQNKNTGRVIYTSGNLSVGYFLMNLLRVTILRLRMLAINVSSQYNIFKIP